MVDFPCEWGAAFKLDIPALVSSLGGVRKCWFQQH